MPPSRTAATGFHLSRSPVIRPGVKFSRKSAPPAGRPRRRLDISSSPSHSRPSIKSRSSTPISAPVSMKCSLRGSGRRPPLPKASPSSR